eukprot:8653074-Pyramimonas_sp.AAC.1
MSLAFSWRLEQVAREAATRAQARLKGRSMTDQSLDAEVRGLQQVMLGRNISGMFLADFAAAFPSIAMSRLLRALVPMQVHPG